MATAASEDDRQQERRWSQQHSRQDALKLAGGMMLGPLAMALGAGPAMAVAGSTADGAAAGTGIAGASTHKSLKELQFEMMKLGLDLT